MFQIVAGIAFASFKEGSGGAVYIDERFLRVQLFGVFEVALGPLRMVLLQADEASDGVGLGNRGKADGLCRVFKGIGQIAEVAEGLTAEKVGGRVKRVGFDGFVQKGDGPCRFKAFAAFCPVFLRFLDIGADFGGNAGSRGRFCFGRFLCRWGVLFSEKGDGEGEPRTPGKERGKGKSGE